MSEAMPRVISKSEFLQGIRCARLAWRAYRGLLSEEDEQTVAQEVGHEVHRLGRTLFRGGKFAKEIEEDYAEILATHNCGHPIFEASAGAAFLKNPDWRLFCRADVLKPSKKGWELIEIKSSTKLKDEHVFDAGFQRYVFESAGVHICKCKILHVNPAYVRRGKLNPRKLFVAEDITEAAAKLESQIETLLAKLISDIEKPEEPQIGISGYCLKHPSTSGNYPCPLKDECWNFLPANSVFTLIRFPKEKAFELIRGGKTLITDIPESALSQGEKLSKIQSAQLQVEKAGHPHIDKAAIRKFLKQIVFPLYALDMETIRMVIPLWKNVSPGQIIPFQYSLHVLRSWDEVPTHYSYLSGGEHDPRPEMLKELHSLLGKSGTILCFNTTFEITRLKEMIAAYPDYEFWFERNLRKRFLDLWEPFRSLNYYHPAQRGSTSIKALLPILTGHSYVGLEISNGQDASDIYQKILFLGHGNKEQVRRHLEDYCHQDTVGLLHILHALRNLTNHGDKP